MKWDKGVLFMTFCSVQASTLLKSKMTFQEVDSLWRINPFLKNEAPSTNHFMDYGSDKFSGRVQYFAHKTNEYEINMFISEMPRAMHSQRVSLQLIVNGL